MLIMEASLERLNNLLILPATGFICLNLMIKGLNKFWLLIFIVSFAFLFYLESPYLLGHNKIKNFSYFIPPDLLIYDAWYGVYINGNYAGYSYSSMSANEVNEGSGYTIKNKLVLKAPVFASFKDLMVDSEVDLGKDYSLKQALLHLKSSGYFLKTRLKKIKGNNFSLDLTTPASQTSKQVKLTDEMINSAFAPLFMSYLPEKKDFSFTYFDPIFERRSTVSVKQIGLTWITLNNVKQDAFEFAINVDGVEGKVYTDSYGHLLRQVFLGVELIKEEPTELFKKRVTVGSFSAIDAFSIASVAIGNKENLSQMKVKISGVDKEFIIEDFNQKALSSEQVLLITRKKPSLLVQIPIEGQEFKEFLAEEDFIQFKANMVEATARKIIGQEKDALKAIELLLAWMDKNIVKTPTFSFPNSLDVLYLKKGDCGELSALLVGFLRSLGIPAYVNIGVVHQDSKFFYHAWVTAFVGEWIDVDPALGQLLADVTHIKMAKGLKKQTDIIKFINKLKIEIIDYQ